MRKPKEQFMTVPEIKRLLSHVSKPRQRLMLLVTFTHGLRVSETTSLRKENIQFGRLYCERKKGSEATTHPFYKSTDPELDESAGLAELALVLKPGELVFPMSVSGVAKLMKRAGKLAGIDDIKVHPHALKHSICRVGIKIMDIHELQKYVGHVSIQSTAQYIKVDDEQAVKAFQGAF